MKINNSKISLNGLKFKSKIGLFDFEKEKGNSFVINVSIDVKKIRFEVNRIRLPIGVEGTFGMIKHPGAALAVPFNDEGNIIVLRHFNSLNCKIWGVASNPQSMSS